MARPVPTLYNKLRGSPLHPQWLTDRYQFRARRTLRRLSASLILDIGSGNSRSAESLNSSNTLVRLDYPEVNRRYALRPDVFGDARNLPIADGTLDAVLLFEVLEHVDTHDRVLREIRRTLRPNGMLFLSVPFLYPIHDAPHDFFRFTIHGIRHVLQQIGFEVTEVTQHGNSFLIPLQMFNLAMLECCKMAWEKHPAFGLAAALLAYPVCLLNNLVALPFTALPDKGAGAFGYFIIARRT